MPDRLRAAGLSTSCRRTPCRRRRASAYWHRPSHRCHAVVALAVFEEPAAKTIAGCRRPVRWAEPAIPALWAGSRDPPADNPTAALRMSVIVGNWWGPVLAGKESSLETLFRCGDRSGRRAMVARCATSTAMAAPSRRLRPQALGYISRSALALSTTSSLLPRLSDALARYRFKAMSPRCATERGLQPGIHSWTPVRFDVDDEPTSQGFASRKLRSDCSANVHASRNLRVGIAKAASSVSAWRRLAAGRPRLLSGSDMTTGLH